MNKLPSHLFASSTDGSLYDTRDPDWSRKPALRPIYIAGQSQIHTTAELKSALRHGAYAWPGGYPMYFITSDGAALSFDAVRAELRQVLDSVWHRQHDGWRVVAVDTNWEDTDLYCAHTNERIPSAYADNETEESDETENTD